MLSTDKLNELVRLARNVPEMFSGPWQVTARGASGYLPHFGVETVPTEGRSLGFTIAYAQTDNQGYGNGSPEQVADLIAALDPETVIELVSMALRAVA